MIVRALDSNHDWTFGKGRGNFLKDDAAIQQNVKCRILSWVGDCFFALREGVDWKSRLDVGQQEALREELKSVILQSEGVVAVTRIEAEFTGDDRLFHVSYDITTIFSPSFLSTIDQAAGVS